MTVDEAVISAANGATIQVFCSHRELVPIEKVVENPRNPNKHPDSQLALLAKIIAAQGWRNPIVVSTRSGFVVSGHGRLQAARALGCERVPVDYQDFSDEASEWAHMVADNRIAEFAEMDVPMLKDLILEMDTGAFDMDLTGFTSEALGKMFSTPDSTPMLDRTLLYQIVVTCSDESNQREILERLEGEGLKCRALIL